MLACMDQDGIIINSMITTDITATIGGLTPYSSYMCSVTASNSAGDSPPASRNFTTAIDSK